MLSGTEKRLAGRDEHGFLLGSRASREASKYNEDGTSRSEMDMQNEARRRARAEMAADKDVRRARLILEQVPAWLGNEGSVRADKRWYDRNRAKEAARLLGVDPPEWAARVDPFERLRVPEHVKLSRLMAYRSNPTPKAKSRARSAAEKLGVEVPEWAALAPTRVLTLEHREKIREASLRRYRRAENAGVSGENGRY